MINKFGISVVSKFYMLGIQFVGGVCIARFLGAEGYGYFALYFATMQIMAIFFQLGFVQFINKEVAILKSSGKPFEYLYLISRRLTIGTGLVVASLYLICDNYFRSMYESDGLIVISTACFMALLAISAAYLRGIDEIHKSLILDEIVRSSVFLILVLILIYGGYPNKVHYVLTASLFAYVLSVLVAHVLTKNKDSTHIQKKISNQQYGKTLLLTYPFLLVALVQVGLYYVELFIISRYHDAGEIGRYRIAMQFADGINVVLVSISVLISSKLAVLFSEGKYKELSMLLTKWHTYAFYLMFSISSIVLLAKDLIFSNLIGSSFSGAEDILSIILSGRVITSVFAFSGLTMLMIGRSKELLYITISGYVITYFLFLSLLDSPSLIDFAVANAFVNLVINFAGVARVRMIVKKTITPLGV